MDTYQPIYDAVRSRLSHADFWQIAEPVVHTALGCLDGVRSVICQEVTRIAEAMTEPSAVYRPTLTVDGNQWCALYGENLQDGVAGFGDTPAAAMLDFDKAWGTCRPGSVVRRAKREQPVTEYATTQAPSENKGR